MLRKSESLNKLSIQCPDCLHGNKSHKLLKVDCKLVNAS